MGAVVEIFQAETPAVPKELGDGGVFTVAQVLPVREKEPLHGTAHDHAVGEDRHAAALMTARHLLQRLQKAAGVDGESLAFLHRPLLRPVGKGIVALRVHMVEIAERKIFPHAAVHLPEARLRVKLQPLGDADGLGRRAGAGQVAGVDRVDGHAVKPFGQSGNLLHAVGCDKGIILALQAAEDIALRFRMADEVKRCHRITTYLPMSAFIFRAASSAQSR